MISEEIHKQDDHKTLKTLNLIIKAKLKKPGILNKIHH